MRLMTLMIVLTMLVCGLRVHFAAGEVVNPYLTTDRSVDTRSARSIVGGLIAPGMTEEEKVLTIFNWARRVMYHSGPEEPMRHDFNLMINVFGYGSCYMQTHPLSHLFHQAGYPTRNWIHNTHHMLEVYYDGAWHCMDPHMSFYVYNRATPRAIASVAELRKDETLAGDAVKEGRTGPYYLICGDKPKWFSGDEKWTLDHPFLPHNGADETFGAIRLPRGMRFVRTWKPGPFFKPHAFGKDGVGPYHTCGAGSDRKDKVNWALWEPYVAGGRGRHYASGYMEYAPDLRGGGWKDGTLRHFNLVGDPDTGKPALHPAAGGVDGEAIFFIDCPYIIVGAKIQAAVRAASGGKVQVAVSKDWRGRSRVWKDVELTDGAADVSDAVAGAMKGFWVRVTMTGDDPAAVGLDSLKVHADFQLNAYALPQLMPGKNVLTLTAERADVPWNVRVSWSEGDKYETAKEFKATVKGREHTAAVEVGGEKIPRMETIELSVDP